MIEIYSPENTEFDMNGDMTLLPEEATVNVILGSVWGATLVHPVDDDGRWKYIEQNAVVKMPSFNGDQLWRIVTTEKSNSEVTATMQPIFYDCANEVFLTDVRPTSKNGQEALDILMDGTKYAGVSDIEASSTAYYEYVNLLEALAGDIDQSFLNRWGGEIVYDNFTVQINEQAGEDNGVEIRYGKNLPENGLIITEDMTDVVTRIYPKGYDGVTMSNNGYVDSDRIDNYPTVRAATITFDYIYYTADMEDDEIAELEESDGAVLCATQDELDAALEEACQAEFDEGLDLPTVTVDAKMILLQNTEQYKDVEVLESVSIGDTVKVIDTNLGFSEDLRVIELQYDAITEKIEEVILGEFEYDYFTSNSQTVSKLVDSASTSGSTTTDYASALKLDSAVGSGTNPIYFKKTGVPVASSSTVGGTSTPVYLADGKITKLSDSLGSGKQPIYLSSGKLTASGTTVGSSSAPVFLSSGTLTKCTEVAAATADALTTKSVGDSSTPVYIDSNGVPQECDLDLSDSSDFYESFDLYTYLNENGGLIYSSIIIGTVVSLYSATTDDGDVLYAIYYRGTWHNATKVESVSDVTNISYLIEYDGNYYYSTYSNEGYASLEDLCEAMTGTAGYGSKTLLAHCASEGSQTLTIYPAEATVEAASDSDMSSYAINVDWLDVDVDTTIFHGDIYIGSSYTSLEDYIKNIIDEDYIKSITG